MTANVKSVVDTPNGNGLLLQLEDGSKPVWTPVERDVAVALIGKPIPDDWFRKDGDYGPQAFPPRKGGGGGGGQAAWRNTKEGFAAETEGRQRWQQIEEERRDRRTALMQAVALTGDGRNLVEVMADAEFMYDWLRETSGAVAAGGTSASRLEPVPDAVPSAGGEAATGSGPGGPNVTPTENPPGPTTVSAGPADYPSDWPQERPR